MKSVGLIGLGVMGSGMAANWLKKGFPLSIYNRTRAKAEAFAGARVAGSPREAAAKADVVFSMVADDDASRAVWLGESGALAGLQAGMILIETSTLSPGWVGELAAEAMKRGCAFLDAPVGGSKGAAANGQLTMFVGGEAATLEAARPALEAISAKIVHLGAIGAGSRWKLVNNMMIAIEAAALAEGLRLAEAAGFGRQQALATILASAAASPIMQMKAPRIAARDFANPDFAVKLMSKDARYVLALAEKLGVTLDVARGAEAAFARAEADGLGELDFSAVAG
jgi:3-hydroxyisobutyrate dehydrogenase